MSTLGILSVDPRAVATGRNGDDGQEWCWSEEESSLSWQMRATGVKDRVPSEPRSVELKVQRCARWQQFRDAVGEGVQREGGQYSVRKELNLLPVSCQARNKLNLLRRVSRKPKSQQRSVTSAGEGRPRQKHEFLLSASGPRPGRTRLRTSLVLSGTWVLGKKKGGGSSESSVSFDGQGGRAEGGGRVMEGIEPTLCSSRACALPSLA